MDEMPKVKVILECNGCKHEHEFNGVTVIGENHDEDCDSLLRWGAINMAKTLFTLLEDTPMSAQAIAIGAMIAKTNAEEDAARQEIEDEAKAKEAADGDDGGDC